METPSGSPPSGGAGSPPERPAPPFTPRATYEEPRQDEPYSSGTEAAETPASESLDVTPENTAPETGIAADAPPEPPRSATSANTETRPPAPPPPLPPLRYGEPRPAITLNRVGEPIRVSEPPVGARPPADPNAATPISPSGATQMQGTPQPQGQSQGSAYPPPGGAPVITTYAPQPQSSGATTYAPQPQTQTQTPPPPPPQPQPQASPQPPQPQPQPQTPQAQAQTWPETGTNPYPYSPPPSYPAPAATSISPPPAQPRPYGSPYPPPPSSPSPGVAPAGYVAANTLTPAVRPARSTSGLNNGLLTAIAALLAIIAIVQVLGLLRPTRIDTTAPVQVQTKPISQTTRDQVKNTLDTAQKAITDINTQAQTDYNAATTDAQRQAILAKYSFTLQQIIAQEQYDILRMMQEQSAP